MVGQILAGQYHAKIVCHALRLYWCNIGGTMYCQYCHALVGSLLGVSCSYYGWYINIGTTLKIQLSANI
jgi:hypothetical protein